MAQPSDDGFRVTDRRRRDPIDESAPSRPGFKPRPASPFSAEIPSGVPAPRSLAGLFVMLGTEAVIALGEAPDPGTGQRQRELPHDKRRTAKSGDHRGVARTQRGILLREALPTESGARI